MKAIKARYDNIDYTKNIFAICVVAVHVFTLATFDNVILHLFVNGIARLAVPFFFCCTGFFMTEKAIENKENLVAFTKKTLITYAYLTAIYLPFVISELVYKGNLNLTGLLQYLHIAVVEGTYLHLWYFPATIIAVWLLHFLTVWQFKTKHILVIGGFLYFFGLFGDGYYGLLKYLPSAFSNFMAAYETIFITTRNGLFFGLPFIILGYYISKNKQQKNSSLLKAQFGLCCALLLIESYILLRFDLAKDYNLMIMLIPTLYFGFNLLLIDSNKTLRFPKFKKGFSTFFYYYHILAFGIILGCNTVFNIKFLGQSAIQFILVMIILIIAFHITDLIKHSKRRSSLK